MKRFVYLSVMHKIILLTCGTTFLACILLAGFTFHRLYDVSIRMAIHDLSAETETVALRFQESYKQMANDVFIIQHTPPIQGIIRSQQTGIDPQDGSTIEGWKTRLATIFLSIMHPRQHYTQMRYIGLAHHGRELVRVNRTEHGFDVVPSTELQPKLQEPYLQDALHLTPDDVMFSDITYNREHGQEDGRKTPTLRVVTPVYHQDSLFGFVVINTHFRTLLEQAFKAARPTHKMMVINHTGDYATYDPETESLRIALTEDPDYKALTLTANIPQDSQATHIFEKNGLVSAFSKLDLTPTDPNGFLTIVLQASKSSLLAQARRTQVETLTLCLLLTFLSLFIAGMVGRRLLHPLQRMTKSIATNKSGKPEDLDLPTGQIDEIGDLARAFYYLTSTLQKSEVKARGIDSLIDGVVTINQHGIIESFNPACEKIFGYTSHDVIGKNVSVLMPDEMKPKHDAYLERYQKTGRRSIIGVGREVEGLRKNGEVFPMEISVTELKTPQGSIFTGVLRDITERKQIDRMKDAFISTVNHELRTPLTSIQGSLGLLQAQNKDVFSQKNKRLLQISYENCTRLTNLVNDILDIEKIAAGKMDYLLENVDVVALTQKVVERHKTLEETYQVTFDVQLKAQQAICRIDSDRYHQALTNLLSNAAKFSPEGGVVTISVSVEEEGRVVIISVTDNGPGIPTNFRNKIFGKFAQADGSSTRSKGGSGLGLNITKSIIEAFGGAITFETELHKGTTFRFWLPVTLPSSLHARPPQQKEISLS